MESLTTISWIGCALALLISASAGYLLGVRRAKRAKRDLQLAMNAQSLELLEARAETRKLSQYLGAAKRKDRVLELALTKLRAGTASETKMRQQLEDIDRKNFIEKSRLNMDMIESKQRAKRAAQVARDASFRLRLLEKALPNLQTISAPEPKSYGQGEAVTVSVVDKHAPVAKHEQANKVSNRDLHRLASLKSSNEQVCTRPTNTVPFPPNVAAVDTQPAADEPRADLENEQILPKNTSANRAP